MYIIVRFARIIVDDMRRAAAKKVRKISL